MLVVFRLTFVLHENLGLCNRSCAHVCVCLGRSSTCSMQEICLQTHCLNRSLRTFVGRWVLALFDHFPAYQSLWHVCMRVPTSVQLLHILSISAKGSNADLCGAL